MAALPRVAGASHNGLEPLFSTCGPKGEESGTAEGQVEPPPLEDAKRFDASTEMKIFP